MGIPSNWFWVAICWQGFFNAAGSTNVQRENEHLLKTVTGTRNMLDQISVTLILLESHSKLKEHHMRTMGFNPSSATYCVENHFTSLSFVFNIHNV